MPPHEVVLRGREVIAERTLAFRFSKPAGFAFLAGQAVDVGLPDPSKLEAGLMKHTFSLTGAPRETELTIATRMRDSQFKRVLETLPVGTTVQLEGPFGSFVLHEDRDRPAVFIAGGIGITPFRSILRDELPKAVGAPIFLFYSNPRPEDAAFLDELQTLAVNNDRLTLIATMTQTKRSSSKWRGETGRLTSQFLDRYTRKLAALPIYYVVGPPAMVGGIREMLEVAGVQERDVRSEEFFGY